MPSTPLTALIRANGGFAACIAGVTNGRERVRLERAFERAKVDGHVGWRAADALAVRALGLHPCLVWGDEWFVPVDSQGV